MASSVAEFLAQYRASIREVHLPSGLTVTVRALCMGDFVGVGNLPYPHENTGEGANGVSGPSDEDAARGAAMVEHAIVTAAIAPKMHAAMTADGLPMDRPNMLHIAYVLSEDYAFLAMDIFEQLGLTTEDARAVKTFREDSERADDSTAGGSLSGAAVYNPKEYATGGLS